MAARVPASREHAAASRRRPSGSIRVRGAAGQMARRRRRAGNERKPASARLADRKGHMRKRLPLAGYVKISGLAKVCDFIRWSGVAMGNGVNETTNCHTASYLPVLRVTKIFPHGILDVIYTYCSTGYSPKYGFLGNSDGF